VPLLGQKILAHHIRIAAMPNKTLAQPTFKAIEQFRPLRRCGGEPANTATRGAALSPGVEGRGVSDDAVRDATGATALGYSRRLHVRAFRAERQEHWFSGLESAFTTFGGAASDQALFIGIGNNVGAPPGWLEFCARYAPECETKPLEPDDVILTAAAWKELLRINRWVNITVKPITDLDHWGVVERWNYPDDGRGDCEDYVLLKRRMLMQAGLPRQALLVTVVRDKGGNGHAVLTVKTDKGEFILDNQTGKIALWSETGYHFVKRQSQSDPNVWVAIGEPRPANATASSR
jgi:predicted transglutaminase-like cysteine proteinase